MIDTLVALQWALRPATAALLAELLAGFDLQACVWQHAEEPTALLSLYTQDEAEAQALAERIAAALPAWRELLPEAVGAPTHIVLAREDWAESWKRFFHARRVSPRVVVRPSWEGDALAGPGDCVVEIDPGMCFGTGQHATTVACIGFLDALAASGRQGPVLDAGCGSGILSIAAAKLGYGPIYAFDHDPHAVDTARENAADNGVAAAIHAEVVDLAAWQCEHQWPLVIANILAEVLVAHAPRLVAALEPGPEARLLLAGILHTQFDWVRTSYAALGLELVEVRRIDEWQSGIFARR